MAGLALLALALPPSAVAGDRDCGDFASQREAQDYFESKGGPNQDPDRLDADADGKACEDLPCPCGSAPAPRPKPRPRARTVRIAARITSVVDGDGLRARAVRGGRRYTVRLIGIDAPEFGVSDEEECEARAATRNLRRLSFFRGRGRRVILTTDPTQDRRDRFGRLLAYVTRRDGTNLGEAQLRAGWAELYVFGRPFRLIARFRSAQSRARRGGRGIWARPCRVEYPLPG